MIRFQPGRVSGFANMQKAKSKNTITGCDSATAIGSTADLISIEHNGTVA